MNILITGGTGFIGVELTKFLTNNNCFVTIITRQIDKVTTNNSIHFIKSISQINSNAELDIIINLAGAPIDRRWSENYKNILINSRISITKDIIELIKKLKNKPKLLISASGIGYYGVNNKIPVDEKSSPTDSFTHTLCKIWEEEALKAMRYGVRVCITRLGIVLGKTGGALKKMLPVFKVGIGGKIGHGYQPFSWVHIDDVINIFNFLISNQKLNGIFNVTSPKPVTNKVFTETLGSILKKPTFFTLPPFLIKTIFGEMGNSILLNGLHVIPTKLNEYGYKFQFPIIGLALENILKPQSK